MYVVSTKPRFSIEVTNNDATTVMAGIRINVGGQDIGRAPGYIEVLGRTLHLLPINRSRWFDFPLTREESLQSDKKLIIVFGPSRDPEGVTMIDSIKLLVYNILFLLSINKYIIIISIFFYKDMEKLKNHLDGLMKSMRLAMVQCMVQHQLVL